MSEVHCPKCGAAADERFDCCEVHALTSTEPQAAKASGRSAALEPFIKKMDWPLGGLPDTDVIQCRVVTPNFTTGGDQKASFGLTVADFRKLREAFQPGGTLKERTQWVADILEDASSPLTRPKLCSHEAIIGLDGKWHCQRCGDAMEMSTASEVSEIYPGDDVTDVQPLYASQPSPAATVETKPFSAKENLREVVAQVQADIEAAQLRCSAGSGGRVDQGRPACGQGDEWGNKPTDDPLAAQIERIIRANRLDGIPKISRKIADAITATEPQGAGK